MSNDINHTQVTQDPLKQITKYLRPPKKSDNKYTRGMCVIAGAAINMSGASILAAQSAIKAGAGIVKLFADEQSMPVYAAALVVAVKLYYTDFESVINQMDPQNSSILIGPGAGKNTDEIMNRVRIAAQTNIKLVLDADALNAFARSEGLDQFAKIIHKNTVITPHEGEFERLFGKRIDASLTKTERALEAARILDCTVVLKGNNTVVANRDGKYWVNSDAPTSLATAGSGDVLAGIILAFLARGLDCMDAATLGVALHSECVQGKGYSIDAQDIIKYLGEFLNIAEGVT